MSNTTPIKLTATIPLPPPLLQTPEQVETEKCIRNCRHTILDMDVLTLQESILGALSNLELDNESRRIILGEIVQGKQHLPEDYDKEADELVIENARGLIVKTIPKPAELIHGILYQGGKMSYNASSKMGKTWSLLHLGIAISEGTDWLGFRTTKSRVLFINPELQNFSFESRIQYLARHLTGQNCLENFDYITTRGKGLSSDRLLPILEKMIKTGQYGAIIMDSIYKLYPRDTEENSNSDVGQFLGQLEQLAVHSGAAIIYSHHYSKGNQANKAAIERSSGGGAWGRDPDAVVSVTEHETKDCYTVEFDLRDFAKPEPITIRVAWPDVFRDDELDPSKLRTTQFAAKYTKDVILQTIAVKSYTATELQKELRAELGMSSGTFYTLWAEAKKAPGVTCTNKNWQYVIPAANPVNN